MKNTIIDKLDFDSKKIKHGNADKKNNKIIKIKKWQIF